MIGGRVKLHMCRTTLFGCYISKFPEQFKPNRAEPRFRGRCSVSARGGGCSVSVRSRGECSCSVSVSALAEHKNCVRSRFGGPEPSRAPSTLGSFAGLFRIPPSVAPTKDYTWPHQLRSNILALSQMTSLL